MSRRQPAATERGCARLVIPAFLLLLISTGLPVFIVEVPPLGDYLNHLARTHIIASIDADPLLSRFYVIKWQIIPNLGMDILVPFLARYVDIYLAGKLFVFLTIGLMLTGVAAIQFALYRSLSLGPLVAFLFIYNFSLLLGFLNYLFGLGIALWGIAAWIGLRDRCPLLRAAVSQGFVVILFACHLYAVGLYGLTLLCFEVWLLRKNGVRDQRRAIVDILAFGGPFLVVLPLLMAGPARELALNNVWSWHPRMKLLQAMQWMIDLYYPTLDRTISALVAVAAVWGLWHKTVRIHVVGWIVLFTGVTIYAAMPTVLFGSWAANYRLSIAILFIVLGFIRWDVVSSAARLTSVGAIATLVFVRLTVVGATWLDIDQVYADLRRSFEQIKPGSTILTSLVTEPDFPFNKAWPLNYAVCLAIIDRSVFTPAVFTQRGLQVLTVKSEYRDIDLDNGILLRLSDIRAAAKDPDSALAQGMYWARWAERFDYLLLLYTEYVPMNPLPDRLTLLYKGKVFQLYEVRPPP